jgi:hypothetical protein
MTGRQAQVFISYQRTDEAFARRVHEHLVGAGVRTWMDQYDIPVGAYWPDEIDRGLAASDIVVGILSPDAVESRNVKNEWDWALQRDKRLLLLMTRLTEIPHRYVSINYIDATTADQAGALDALLHTLGVETQAAPVAAAPATAAPLPIRHAVRRVTRRFPSAPALAGREREQTQLTALLDRMTTGDGALVLLGGEAGIGKTSLTSWLGWLAEERGALVLSGGCYDLTTTPPYGPWAEIADVWPDETTTAQSPLPALPRELSGGSGGAAADQAALFREVSSVLAAAAEVRPLVLLLEDLHWSDQGTLDLLRHVARTVTGNRLLLCVTYRDDELTRRHPLYQLLPLLVRESGAERLQLARLTPESTRALVTRRYSLPAAGTSLLVDYVQRLSEGNPFFTGEILRALEEAGALTRAGEAWQVANLERVQVPELARQVIERRLEHLGDEPRRLLEVAAVIGAEVPVELWAAVSEADEEALAATIDRALEARLAEEVAGGARIRFSHALVRETLYEGLVWLRRRTWHRKVAEALAADRRPDPDSVAHHFQQAGDPRAIEWLDRAADRARRAYAWRTASERLEAALELEQDPNRRGWLLYRIGCLLVYADQQRGLSYLVDALHAGAGVCDPVLSAYAMADAGRLRCLMGDHRRGQRELEAALDLIDALPPDHAAAAPWVALTESGATEVQRVGRPADGMGVVNSRRGLYFQLRSFSGPFDETTHLAEAFAAEMESRIDRDEDAVAVLAPVLSGLSLAHAMTGRPAVARAYARRAQELWERAGMPMLVRSSAWAELIFCGLIYDTTDLPERERLMRLSDERWERFGEAVQQSKPVDELLVTGDWTEARRRSYQITETERYTFEDDVVGILARHQGERARAWERVRRGYPQGPATEPGNYHIVVAMMLLDLAAHLALDDGDLAAAREWIDAHQRYLDWSGAVVYEPLQHLQRARHARLSGDLAAALTHARRATEIAAEPRRPLMLLAGQRMTGELLTASGDLVAAEPWLTQSLDLATACAAPFEIALSQVALAELRLAQGLRDAAARLLAEARAICETLGAQPTLERIAALETPS